MAYLYPRSLEVKIGFDKVRTYLKERCQSSMGLSEVDEMAFQTDFRKIIGELNQTAEAKKMCESGNDLPDVSYNELDTWLTPLKVEGSYALPENFLRLKQTLLSFENVRIYFSQTDGRDEQKPFRYPSLNELFSGLDVFPDLIITIDRIIDKSGGVKDSASPDLMEVRQKLGSMQGSIARSIQRLFGQAVKDGLVDKDTSPTLRDGRMVIPVPAVHKRNIRGIIHDESATGKTVFIEPAETVEMSNRMRELEIEEQRIIVRILTALADEIRPSIDYILLSNRLLGKLDFIMAKARFAIEIGGELPNFSKHTEIDWYGAVHPVLFFNLRKQGKQVVPLSLRLEGKKRILVISGPNAGGKSVALKTVGIIQYMTQCGLLPSMHSNSHVGLFNKIFIDIGDEQSIENDLSTYSSHLKNMRQFLLHADGKSLILIDEIGSGTEPNIGSALAKSVLQELAKSKCFGVITTHYHNLKRFAEENSEFVNGAMLYDRQKLLPTFQLSVGNAGSSFALEIATKIGLPKNVIESAKQDIGDDYVESDKFLMEIARDRKYWQAKRDSIRERESKLDILQQKYERIIAELTQKRKEIIKEAQKEAKQLLEGANKKIENTIADIRQAEAEKERTKQIRKDLATFKDDIEELEINELKINNNLKLPKDKKYKNKTKETRKPSEASNRTIIPNKELSDGDYVKMIGSNTIGKIISISGKNAEVAFGNFRTKLNLSQLTHTTQPAAQQKYGNGYVLLNQENSDASRQRQLNFRDELDIRGMRAEEALDKVIHFIDDAIQFGIGKVRILHGTGGGILRQLVRQQMSITPGVAKYEDEDVRMGGTGITVVTLSF